LIILVILYKEIKSTSFIIDKIFCVGIDNFFFYDGKIVSL
jgi:hypothetical protein